MSKMMGKIMEKSIEASYTVEAALIMAITLFLMASLLTEAFRVHSQVTADMILQEALEQSAHREGETRTEEILEKANRSLQSYFRCKDMQIYIEEKEKCFEGTASGSLDSYEHKISIKAFDPEGFLRLLRAIGI